MQMRTTRSGQIIIAGLLALVALFWTDNNQALLRVSAETVSMVDNQACNPPESCDLAGGGYLVHWVSKTRVGNLFLVLQTECADVSRCSARFVERTPVGLDARLNIEGQFRVLYSGKSIPDVQTWRNVSENEVVYTRYSWANGGFLKVDTRTVYRVDGVECGSAQDCYQSAFEAYRNKNTDKALRIWEQVHKVSWI